MFEQAERTIEFVGQLPPAAFIGALLVALVIALTTVGTYRWLAGRKPDALMLLVCLVLLANLACTLAAGQMKRVLHAGPAVRRGPA